MIDLRFDDERCVQVYFRWHLTLPVLCTLFAVAQSIRQVIEVRFSVEEEVPENTEIGEVLSASGLRDAYSDDVVDTLRFQFLNHPPVDISIEERLGLIRTRGRIDREALCARLPLCEVRVDVAVRPMTFFQIVKVTVDVLDVNDNAPQFRLRSNQYEVVESVLPGWGLAVPAAVDQDVGRFSVTEYVLDSGSEGLFELKVEEKTDETAELKLVSSRTP